MEWSRRASSGAARRFGAGGSGQGERDYAEDAPRQERRPPGMDGEPVRPVVLGGVRLGGFLEIHQACPGPLSRPCRRGQPVIGSICARHPQPPSPQHLPVAAVFGLLAPFSRPKRSASRTATRGLTNGDTSPPSWPISLTKREEMNWYLSLAIKNTVSTLELRRLFMPAIWNSYSKSE